MAAVRGEGGIVAIIFATGFEDGTLGPFGTGAATTAAAPGGSPPPTPPGGQYHHSAYNPNALTYVVPTPLTEMYVGFHFYTGNWYAFNSTMFTLNIRSGGNRILTLTLGADNKLFMYYGTNATPIGPSTMIMEQYRYYHIELGVVVGPTGSAEVRVDGTTILELASGDTRPSGGGTTADRIVLHSGNGLYAGWDNIVIDDADWPGEIKIIALTPNGTGNLQEFTPSTGTDHAALVDERPPTTTDYVYSTTPGHREQFSLADHGLSGGIIVEGVQVIMHALESESAGMTLDTGLRVNGANYDDGKVHALLTASSRFEGKIWETNPDTGAAWTLEEINNLQAGVKVL
jgi:hypothetical protein